MNPTIESQDTLVDVSISCFVLFAVSIAENVFDD